VVAVPSGADAKGLLLAASRDPDPVIFLERSGSLQRPLSTGHHDQTGWRERGKSHFRWAKRREGYLHGALARPRSAAKAPPFTILAYGTMVYVARPLSKETRIDAEDHRSQDAVLAA